MWTMLKFNINSSWLELMAIVLRKKLNEFSNATVLHAFLS